MSDKKKKIYRLSLQDVKRLKQIKENLQQEETLDEITSTMSSGSFETPMGAGPVKREFQKPVTMEDEEAGYPLTNESLKDPVFLKMVNEVAKKSGKSPEYLKKLIQQKWLNK